jgi:hypothetical protein
MQQTNTGFNAACSKILAVYLHSKHIIHQEQLEDYYYTLGHRFIAGGDYNAKHTNWGS